MFVHSVCGAAKLDYTVRPQVAMLEGHAGRSWGYTEDFLGELGVPCAPARSEHLDTLQRDSGYNAEKGTLHYSTRCVWNVVLRHWVNTARRFVRM